MTPLLKNIGLWKSDKIVQVYISKLSLKYFFSFLHYKVDSILLKQKKKLINLFDNYSEKCFSINFRSNFET
eukprot:EC823434.1.p1 GENE.EC823434.1~~EC823434.1.p1  ORF type:complete len:71 (-),score=2.84 EC823434.1:410-622(-)